MMKSVKLLAIVVLSLMLLGGLPRPARADVILYPSDDSFVRNKAGEQDTNFDEHVDRIHVSSEGFPLSVPVDIGYVRFDLSSVSGSTMTGATLRLWGRLRAPTNTVIAIWSSDDDDWNGPDAGLGDETTLTYNNAPLEGSQLGPSLSGDGTEHWWEFGSTALRDYVLSQLPDNGGDGWVTLRVKVVSTGIVDVQSFEDRESGAASGRTPQLVLLGEPSSDAPTLSLVKTVTNDDGGDNLANEWTLAAGGTGGFSGPGVCDDIDCLSATNGPHQVLAGVAYNLSESGGPSGYAAGTWSCSIDGGGPVAGSTITLAEGQSGVCTIHNDDELAPSLTLIKTVTHDSGGDNLADEWTLTASGTGGFSGPGTCDDAPCLSATNGPHDVVANVTYSLSESGGPSGYAANTWSCSIDGGGPVAGSTITLAAGQSGVCTIHNNDVAPLLSLVKTVTRNDGGDNLADEWTLTATGTGGFSGPGTCDDVDCLSATNGPHGVVANATYSLSESGGPSGYTASAWSCRVNGGAPVVGSSLTLTEGQIGVCTINNDDVAPSLTLLKTVTNDSGGDNLADDWTLSATGTGGFSGPGTCDDAPCLSATNGPHLVKANVAYSLSESGPSGYAASAWSCSIDGGGPVAGSTITLSEGESGVCTISNDDMAASLALVKTVTNNDGGDNTADEWTLAATGTGGFAGPGVCDDVDCLSATNGPHEVVPNVAYSLSESGGPSGYGAGTWSCSIDGGEPVAGSNITLAEGESAVCTLNNNDLAPLLSLVKTVTNDDGRESLADEWTLTATGTGGFSGAGTCDDAPCLSATNGPHLVRANVTYSLSESGGPGGYSAGAWSCRVNGGAPVVGDSITLAEGQSGVCTINNDDLLGLKHIYLPLVLK